MTHPDHDRVVPSDDPPDDTLRALVAQAGSLPTLRPSRDLWPGIAARLETPIDAPGDVQIDPRFDPRFDTLAPPPADHGVPPRPAPVTGGARVLPVHVRRIERPVRIPRLAAAAVALAALSSGATYLAMRQPGVAPVLVASQPALIAAPPASEPLATSPSAQRTVSPAVPLTPASADRANLDEPRSAPHPRAALHVVARAIDVTVPGAADYDREIADLRTVVGERRGELDSATVAVLTRNLRIIDAAIAASRAALARDPRSPFLGEQLTRSLGQKVELLRTAALLPHT